MKALKNFLMGLFAFVPLSAGAVAPLVIGGTILGIGGIIGASVWRSVAPVNMQDALDFFTSCWTCQIFSDVMVAMSDLLPKVYTGLAKLTIPIAIILLMVLIAWRVFSGYFGGKIDEPLKIIGNFGTSAIKLTLFVSFLLMPLPRMITNVLIEPAMTVGTSLDYAISDIDTNNRFAQCMVATAVVDPVTKNDEAVKYGAFSPKIRHQLACEVANVHQITGLGMTIGWTLMGMAFNDKYMAKILDSVPVFPNVPMFLAGVLILFLYFMALLPIPLFFLEIFIKLSMDLIMLPLMLLAWLFDDENFAIFPQGGQTIRKMIEDVIKGVVGIALTIVFLTFSVKFLNAAFGNWGGVNRLQQAIMTNDSKFFMDGLVMQNDSIVTVVLMGVFLAMFMTMIPQLTDMLFKIKISDKYYKTAESDIKNMWESLKKMGTSIKK